MFTTTRSGPRATLRALAVLALGLVAAPLAAAPAATAVDRPVVLTKGHIDGFELTYDRAAGKLVLAAKDDTRLYADEIVYRDPSTVTFAFSDAAKTALPPATGTWAFLGAHGGQEGWLGPETQNPAEPWIGWSTERLQTSLAGTGFSVADSGTPVSLNVDIVGPGDVFQWQTVNFAPGNRYIDTTTPEPDVIPVASHAHVHTNWLFTAAGDYYFTVTPTVQTVEGATLTGDPTGYHVRIGGTASPAPTLAVQGAGATYVVGQTAILTAAQAPDSGLRTYQWQVGAAGQEAFRDVPGATGATYERALAAEDDGARVRVLLRDPGDVLVATSEPVVLSVAEASPDLPTAVTISGVRALYSVGEQVSLTAVADVATTLPFRWSTRAPGATSWATVDGVTTATFSRAAPTDGLEVKVAVLDDNESVVVESAPVAVRVPGSDPEPTPTPDPTATPDPDPTPAPRPEPAAALHASVLLADAALTSANAGSVTTATTSATARSTVTIRVSGVADGTWVMPAFYSEPRQTAWVAVQGGAVQVEVPADLPAGAHKVALYAQDGALLGWAALDVAATPSAGSTTDAPGALASTGSELAGPLVLAGTALPVGVCAVLARRRVAAVRRDAPGGAV